MKAEYLIIIMLVATLLVLVMWMSIKLKQIEVSITKLNIMVNSNTVYRGDTSVSGDIRAWKAMAGNIELRLENNEGEEMKRPKREVYFYENAGCLGDKKCLACIHGELWRYVEQLEAKLEKAKKDIEFWEEECGYAPVNLSH